MIVCLKLLPQRVFMPDEAVVSTRGAVMRTVPAGSLTTPPAGHALMAACKARVSSVKPSWTTPNAWGFRSPFTALVVEINLLAMMETVEVELLHVVD
jgi:hypothetical protein